MVDILGTARVEVVGLERIDVSLSGASCTSNEGSLKGRSLTAFDVFDHVAWSNLSAFHPSESALVSGARLCTSYVLCAEVSDTLDNFGENSRSRSIDLPISLINWKFFSPVLALLFLGFASDCAFIIANPICWIKWVCMPCRNPRLLSYIVICDVIITIWTRLGALVSLTNCGALNIITFYTITSC